jgi:PilZ domain
MSDEKNVGFPYVNALRQGMTQASGRATASAAEPREGKAVRQPPPAEKRKSQRFRCQGSAQLREISTGVPTWATFTDISLHGCYVEVRSTFRIGADLALTIEVNSYRVECGAVVRVVYPGLGMGIAFTAMSAENRKRLNELLQSLTHPSFLLGARPASAPASTLVKEGPAVADPGAALAAISKYFEERQMLGRDEFFRILRKSQG